jgi:hypothetical protein
MASKTPRISDVEFVSIWQQSESLRQAAALCGYASRYGEGVASNRARRLRARGVRLKRFDGGPTKGDVRRLNLVVSRVEARRDP